MTAAVAGGKYVCCKRENTVVSGGMLVWGVICGELALWIEVARGEVELCVIIDVAKVGC